MAQTELSHRVATRAEMDAWPVDRLESGEKRWAESTWGAGPLDGPGRLLYNWNTWPCRVVFEVRDNALVARGEAAWRRSQLSVRMKGLKLVAAATGEDVRDAVLVRYDGECVIIDFRPVAGPGLYHLYYAAADAPRFSPSAEWLARRDAGARPARAAGLRIEARCAIDDFDVMERVATAAEVAALLDRHAQDPYLVFPEDRDRPIKLQFELPAHWTLDGPRTTITLAADRNEYRVFQLGVWAARCDIPNVHVRPSDLQGPGGAWLPAGRVQCLTLETRARSRHIVPPNGRCRIPQGQIRALWFGIDIPEDAPPGDYTGSIAVRPEGQPAVTIPLHLTVSDRIIAERGDHDLSRLSRLRWIESDVGLSDAVFPPYQPLRIEEDGRLIRTWGHTVRLGPIGLPAAVDVGPTSVLAGPVTLQGRVGRRRVRWGNPTCRITRSEPGVVEWAGHAEAPGATLLTVGRMEYDGCVLLTVSLTPSGTSATEVRDLTLTVPWRRESAALATGMGYRGRRDGDRAWRLAPRDGRGFSPSVWMGSVHAGLGWATWVQPPGSAEAVAGLSGVEPSTGAGQAWDDPSRPDAATITERGRRVELRLRLGTHRLAAGTTWSLTFALLPTPVKPRDDRHWDFRYMHKGGGFRPSDGDTPQSFLKDGCRRLDMVVDTLGVRRLNLHDWWGPAFNYPWQWDGPDNLARLTAEAHRRGLRVKVYNSGRELSIFAPEFWALAYEGTSHRFRDSVESAPRLWFQDAWRQNHLPDGFPAGWPRVHDDRGNEHAIPVSNATRNGNFYLESMRYMTRFFGTDGAYWDGADGPSLGHREMAKRLWVMFRQTNPDATTDVHHGHSLIDSPISAHMLCFPFVDSLWHGEGFDYDRLDPWAWLVEVAALPFGVPSEMLGGEDYLGRGMLFGIWPRHGWYRETEDVPKLWRFFSRFGIRDARMLGWWDPPNGVTLDRPDTLATAFCHPENGVLLALATWHPQLAAWMEMTLDVSLLLDRKRLGLPRGKLVATDVLSDAPVDLLAPVPLPDAKAGRLLWIRPG